LTVVDSLTLTLTSHYAKLEDFDTDFYQCEFSLYAYFTFSHVLIFHISGKQS